ncbi:energy transducer TonB [Mesorhizobium sp. YC-39]|uniref:energy transducer TonB family protein n=1 Tax=unclassified Mesorhizobium TaxID=325217 RepID=UPI0021E7FA52|nr:MULTISPECIES: energy transducer TonB [unclassified Mesorhizobium]MCV3208134.1 energy transducer TonB [Mesorhizobium sp. YC-2]MCV3229861.1 energy transducer TonB [Mesorhizobium sp. YC-39]
MSMMAASPTVDLSRLGARETGLWAAAAALVLAAHVAIAYAVQDLRPAEMDGGPPPAQLIELSPMVIMPAEEADVADVVTPDAAEPVEEVETAEAKPVTEPEPPVEIAEPVAEPPAEQAESAAESPQTAATDAIEPAQPPMPERVDQLPLEEVVPDIVETVAPDVVIPLPQPKPVEAPVEAEVKKPVKAKKPIEAKKPEAKAKKPVEKVKKTSKKEKAAPAKTAAASATAKPAPRAAAPKSAKASASASRGDASKWNSQLSAWIRRHTRYPSAAKARGAQGSPKVTFTVDASGRVLSARLAGSSGDSDLDRAALSALQGAKVPTPPQGLGSRITRTAPFLFNLR